MLDPIYFYKYGLYIKRVFQLIIVNNYNYLFLTFQINNDLGSLHRYHLKLLRATKARFVSQLFIPKCVRPHGELGRDWHAKRAGVSLVLADIQNGK